MSVPVSPVIRINDGQPWNTGFALFVMPGQELTLQSEAGGFAQKWEGDGDFIVPASLAGAALVQPAGSARLTWRAPRKAGPMTLVLKTAQPGTGWVESARLNVQVMAPARQLVNGVLDGYRIGRYPRPVPSSPVGYYPPNGFLKIPESASIPVSPRFNLEDFASKQPYSGARYVALQPRLLPFLEAIASMVEDKGFVSRNAVVRKLTHGDGDDVLQISQPITIMSGFRTPVHNSTLNTAELSRHQYGDASDIIIDANGDGSMDDLNKDGRVNGRDALTLAAWIEDLWKRPEFVDQPGGMGVYNGTGAHGPFVHVDLRGERARWGGNGLEWSDAAVARAARDEQEGTIQLASYSRAKASRSAVRSSRSHRASRTSAR